MKCSRCGTENEGKFCINCGSPFINSNNPKNDVKENKKLHDEGLNSIMNMTKKIIEQNKEITNDIAEQENVQTKNQLIDNNGTQLMEPVTEQQNNIKQNTDEIVELGIDNTEIKKDIANITILEQPVTQEIKLFDSNTVKQENLNPFEAKTIDENNNDESSMMFLKSSIDDKKSFDEPNTEPQQLSIIEPIELEHYSEDNIKGEDTKKVVNNSKFGINKIKNKFAKKVNDNKQIDLEKGNLDIFIGKNAEKIIYRKYNILPAILGNIWLLYRKCYLVGTILGIFDFIFILYVIFFTTTPVYVYFILKVILYFVISKEIYINHSKRKIRMLEDKYKDLPREEFVNKLIKIGGTNILAPIIYIITIMLITILGFYYIYNVSTYKFYELKVRGNGWVLNNDEGLIYSDNEKTCVADIYYGTKIDSNIMGKLYEKGIISEEQYLNKTTDYNFNELDKENINKIDWYKLTVVDENSMYEDVYVTIKNDAVYFINFKGNNQNDYNLCQEKFIDLKSSFNFE